MKLTTKNVTDIFTACLFKEGENTENKVLAEGVTTTANFNSLRLEQKKDSIINLLDQLPEKFMAGKGGGYSFLMMCMDKSDVQWTGLHSVQDQLVCLGLAIERVHFLFPRDWWQYMYGGVPYLTVIPSEL